MKKLLVGIYLFVSSQAMAQQMLGIKEGLYKVQTKIVINGKETDLAATIAAQLKAIPAEQRGMLEKELKKANPDQICILKEDLAQDKFADNLSNEQNCKYTMLKSTPKEYSGKADCEGGHTTFRGNAPNANSFHFVTESVAKETKDKMKYETKGVFVSATCPPELIAEKKKRNRADQDRNRFAEAAKPQQKVVAKEKKKSDNIIVKDAEEVAEDVTQEIRADIKNEVKNESKKAIKNQLKGLFGR